MKKLTRTAGLVVGALLSFSAQAGIVYNADASITLDWGVGGSNRGWTASGVNSLGTLTDGTYFTTVAGSNSVSYFNSDFATASDGDAGTAADDCLTPPAGDPGNSSDPGYNQITLRRYGCRISDTTGYNSPLFKGSQILDAGPAASASGNIQVTDTTITGTLNVLATTDEGGATGFNYRSADGSPFGNVWYGVSSSATLTLDLTGTFNATTWEITGGAARLSDPSFQCEQGGFGGGPPGFILCNPSVVAGGFQSNGAALSFGWDIDGSNPDTVMTEIEVRDSAGVVVLDSLSGMLASLVVDGGGSITTTTGEYRSGLGSSGSGCPTHIRWSGSAISCGSLTAGLVNITGSIIDPPDAFTFTDVTNVALSTVQTSNTITVSGTAATNAISVTGGEYSVGCTDPFTATAGTIGPGGTVCVRHSSAATGATDTDTVLTIGGVSDTFTSTTLPADTTPDAFAFTAQTDVNATTAITSNTVTVAGIDSPAAISIAGGTSPGYSIGCTGTFTATAGTINNGQTVCVRQTSSGSATTATDTVLSIGGVDGTFTVTTSAVQSDTNPDQFQFVDQNNVARDTVIVSAPVTITGINSPAAISVTGGGYSIGCTGTYTTTAATITSGQTVCVSHTSASTAGTAVTTVLTVGTAPNSKSDAFSSGTRRSGGSSSVDGFSIALLGLLALAGRRRRVAR